MSIMPVLSVLGEEAERLLEVARNEDESAWLPLSDLLEGDGQDYLAELVRGGWYSRAFFMKVRYWLERSGFDRETMAVVVQIPPFSVDRRWIVWKSMEVKPGWYNRVAIVMKGGRP